jgi:hypothetical protein
MINQARPQPRRFWRAEFLSPTYLLVRAFAMVLLFLVVQLAGLREYTAFLSGTAASPETGMRLCAFYGMVYILFYLGCVVVAPILILAAGLVALWNRVSMRFRTNA